MSEELTECTLRSTLLSRHITKLCQQNSLDAYRCTIGDFSYSGSGGIFSLESVEDLLFRFCAFRRCLTTGENTGTIFLIKGMKKIQIYGSCFAENSGYTAPIGSFQSSSGSAYFEESLIARCPKEPSPSKYHVLIRGSTNGSIKKTNVSFNSVTKYSIIDIATSRSFYSELNHVCSNVVAIVYDHHYTNHYVNMDSVVNNTGKEMNSRLFHVNHDGITTAKGCVFIENELEMLYNVVSKEINCLDSLFWGNKFSIGQPTEVSTKPYTLRANRMDWWECETPPVHLSVLFTKEIKKVKMISFQLLLTF